MTTDTSRLDRFLRKLEKYTKTDMVYLARGGFWALSSQIVVSLSSFLLAISFAHFVSQESYGQYKFIMSLASIAGTLTLTGLGVGVMRGVSIGYDGSLHYAFWKNIQWSVLFFITSGIAALYYFIHANSVLGISFLIIGCLSPLISSTNLYSSFLAGKKDFKRNALYFDIIGNIFPALCMCTAMIYTNSVVVLIALYFISNTLIGLVLYYRILKIYSPGSSVDPEMMSYGKHLSFINILNGVVDNIDQVLVFHYIGAAELAVYNFAIAIPDQIKGPVKSLSNLMFPKFAERKDEDIRKGMTHKFFQLFLATIVTIIIYFFVAPYVYTIFFPKYVDAIFYSQLYSISLLWIIFTPASTYLNAKKKIREQYIANLSISTLQISFVCIGIIYGGLIGLILARIANRIMWGVITTILFYTSRTEPIQPIQ